jgi:diguanylate cyclase (GGDEF)-like protein
MLFDGSHWRRLALLFVVGVSTAISSEAPPVHGQTLPVRPPIFQNAENVTCRYRLNGLQKEFTQTNQSEVRYSSLPAGEYNFQVVCDAPREEQGKSGAYSFIVPGANVPSSGAWWQTSWMEMGAFGVVLLVWATLWSRYRDRRENERLERAVAERSAELARANRELQEVSLCDPLTGLRNRRFFQSMIPADASQAVRAYRGSEVYGRDHRDLMFFLVDIDHFKDVNDEYGHDAGDRVLVQIAQRLSRVVRESDFLIRWGGEEFLVVFRAAERNDAVVLASRILKAVNGADFDLGNERWLARSCSVGWAAFPWLPPACSDLSVEEVLRLADRGLYLAKQGGRNQAVGLVPAASVPVINNNEHGHANGSSANKVVTRPGKYCNLERLLEDDLIREVRTLGGISAAAAG